jgi:hypothetical protein
MSILLRDGISVLEKPIKLWLKKRKWPLEPGKLRQDALISQEPGKLSSLGVFVSCYGE